VLFAAPLSAIVTSYDTRLQQWICMLLMFPWCNCNHCQSCGIAAGQWTGADIYIISTAFVAV